MYVIELELDIYIHEVHDCLGTEVNIFTELVRIPGLNIELVPD
jgi:hypothetical protein